MTCFTFNNIRYRLRSKPRAIDREWLYGADHSAGAIAIYIAICAVLNLVATALMSDYTGKDDIPANTSRGYQVRFALAVCDERDPSGY